MVPILLPAYASISGSLEQTNQFALVVGKLLVSQERGTTVIIADWCTAMLVAPKKH